MTTNPSRQGTIRRIYVIECATCAAEDEGSWNSIARAATAWTQAGWRCEDHRWYCPACSAHPIKKELWF